MVLNRQSIAIGVTERIIYKEIHTHTQLKYKMNWLETQLHRKYEIWNMEYQHIFSQRFFAFTMGLVHQFGTVDFKPKLNQTIPKNDFIF